RRAFSLSLKTGPPGHPELGTPRRPFCACDELLASELYFGVTALLATPPPADFTQTVVGVRLMTPTNLQVPSAALTAVVVMRAPVQAPRTAGPLWISTLAAKLPVESRVFTPSTRSWFLATANSARLIDTVSAPAAGAFTT